MQRILPLTLLAAALIAAGPSGSIAQAPAPVLGDYGSVVTGKWDTVSTWKIYSSNGAFDSAATAAPSSSKNVFILTGTTVTYETSSQNCKNLVIESGGLLQSGATLPTGAVYLKINGPTVWVDGAFGSGPTDALSLETKYNGTITLSGSGVINIAQLRPNSGQTGTMAFVFAADANINYAGSSGNGGAGIYTSRGTQTSSTVTIDSGVTVNLATGSHFEMTSNTSNLGTMNTTLNVNGTMNLPASSLILADSAQYTAQMNIGAAGTVNIGGKLIPYLPGGGIGLVDVAAGGVLNILSGGTADYSKDSAAVTGAGTFALQAGGGINIGAAAGLDPVNGPVRTAVAIFDTAGSYSYVGTGVQTWGAMLPDSIRNLTIGGNSIDTATVADAIKVTGILQIDGLLVDNGGLTSTGSAIVNGTYQYNITDPLDSVAAIPTATWNTNSTCLVTSCRVGIASGIPGGNQNFYDFTFDNPTLAGVPRIGFAGDTIRGNLTIRNTNPNPLDGTGNFLVLCPSKLTTQVTVLGDLVIDSLGSVSPGYGSGICSQTLDVKGNIVTNGWMFMNGSGVSNKYFVGGDLIDMNPLSGSIRGHSSTANPDSIIICGMGTQKVLKPVALTSMNHVRWRVAPGSTLLLNDTTSIPVSGNGTFTVDSAATMVLGHPNGINGSIAGVLVESNPNASYVLNSATAQVTGAAFPARVANLTIDDSLGVTLSDTVMVTGTLLLSKGNLLTTDSSMIAIDTAGVLSRTNNYVIGRLQKQFAIPAAKDFEVGTANGYSPVLVTVNTGSGPMTVAAVQGWHPNTFDSAKTLAQYWSLAADPGITNADLRFSYLPADVNGRDSLYGAWKYTGTGNTWTPYTSVVDTTAHTVTVAGVTSFSDWTLGESPTTSVESPGVASVPNVFYVNQNYPNPFNPTTTISYGIPSADYVTLKVYNLLGQEVATIVDGQQAAGVYTLDFDGSRLPSGVYFYRIQAGTSVGIHRMVLLK